MRALKCRNLRAGISRVPEKRDRKYPVSAIYDLDFLI